MACCFVLHLKVTYIVPRCRAGKLVVWTHPAWRQVPSLCQKTSEFPGCTPPPSRCCTPTCNPLPATDLWRPLDHRLEAVCAQPIPSTQIQIYMYIQPPASNHTMPKSRLNPYKSSDFCLGPLRLPCWASRAVLRQNPMLLSSVRIRGRLQHALISVHTWGNPRTAYLLSWNLTTTIITLYFSLSSDSGNGNIKSSSNLNAGISNLTIPSTVKH